MAQITTLNKSGKTTTFFRQYIHMALALQEIRSAHLDVLLQLLLVLFRQLLLLRLELLHQKLLLQLVLLPQLKHIQRSVSRCR